MIIFDESVKNKCNELSGLIIGAAIDVHKELGPGLREATYEECLCYELGKRNVDYKRNIAIPIRYKDVIIPEGYQINLLVDDNVVVELKAFESITLAHKSQMLTYLRLWNKWLGLLINFNEKYLKDGVVRVVNGH